MASAVQKITLSASRDIPFNKLLLSQSNVRRVKAGVSIEELAESIARRGLLQGLHVRAVLDEDGKETGMYEVPAGGRRYRALELLVKQKRLGKTSLVPCVLGDAHSDVLIEEVSLVENMDRAPLHPLDQFRTFKAMRDKGLSEENIAAALFVTVQVVKQRLRLVSVSPALLDIYAEDGMTLEQLMAFSVSSDHQRQEQVWESVNQGWQKEPYHIRRMLTEKTVPASDRRALFVGIEAYEAAGGTVLQDLFDKDNRGYLNDPALLDRLAREKLSAIAVELAAEGWKWIEAAVDIPYGATSGLRKLNGTPIDMTEAELASRDALQAEYDGLQEKYADADELPDEVDERIGELETAIERFEDLPQRYDPADIAISGIFVSIGRDGSLEIDRGFVRPEDELPEPTGDQDHASDGDPSAAISPASAGRLTAITIGGKHAQDDEEEEDDGIKPLPDRLISELTAHRTLALRDALANAPHIAMTVLLHKLVSDAFLHLLSPGVLQASIREAGFPAQSEDLKDCASAKAIAARHEQWRAQLPKDDEALWQWLVALDHDSRQALLAHCVSSGVNALHEKPNAFGGSGISSHGLRVRLKQADRLAHATGLDMVQAGWRPTAANYFGKVTKARILEAVREGAGERAAQLIDHMKKGDMAKEAERLLADAGWLPEPLRGMGNEDANLSDQADTDEGGEDLPSYLSGNGDEKEPSDADEDAAMMAAE